MKLCCTLETYLLTETIQPFTADNQGHQGGLPRYEERDVSGIRAMAH